MTIAERQRERKLISLAVMACMLISFVFVASEHAAAKEKEYRMKIQSLYPRGDISMEALTVFADSAKKYSNGRLKIKVFADPELVPGDQLFDATKQGVVDMLHGMGGMWGGIVPLGYVEFNLPEGFRIPGNGSFEEKAQVVRDFYDNKGFMQLLRDEYAKHGLYLLDIHTYGPVPFVLSTAPATSCADLQGKKIKSDGGNIAYHTGVGMQGVQIPPTEAYMALKLGTVDLAEWDISAVTGMKWHEVAPYWIQGMESDHTLGHILVSLDKWNSLPDELKEAMHAAALDYWQATISAYGAEMDAVMALVAKGEVKVNVLDEACQQKYSEVAQQMWVDLAKQDEASAKAIEMFKELKKDR